MEQHEYIYLQQEREFVNSGENIYKLGKTTQTIDKRFGGYPKGTRIEAIITVISADDSESLLLKLFREKFENETAKGSEYFSGDLIQMLKILHEHQYEQIKISRGSEKPPEKTIKYENSIVEFLEKRTLPGDFRDGREPIYDGLVQIEHITQFYKQWCSDFKKKSLTGLVMKTHVNKFLKNWMWTKTKTVYSKYPIQGKAMECYKIVIFDKDPIKRTESSELKWYPMSWTWYYTSNLDDRDKDRTLISSEGSFHLSSAENAFANNIRDLSIYPSYGWRISCLAYKEILDDPGLVEEENDDENLDEFFKSPPCFDEMYSCYCGRYLCEMISCKKVKSWLPNNFGSLVKIKRKVFLMCYHKTKYYEHVIDSLDHLFEKGRDFFWKNSDRNYKILRKAWNGPVLFPLEGFLKYNNGLIIGVGISNTLNEYCNFSLVFLNELGDAEFLNQFPVNLPKDLEELWL